MTQNWYDSSVNFSVAHFATFSNRNHFDSSLLFNFETTQCKNLFDTNLISIHSALLKYQDIVIFKFCAILVMADGSHLGMLNCKKSLLHAKIIVTQSWYDSIGNSLVKFAHNPFSCY